MDNFIFFITGALLMYLILQKPLRIDINHTTNHKNTQLSEEEITELEQKMLTPDKKQDDLYENLDEVMTEVNNIMGGSDR